ncbi:c-type cytochrome domain-containing protein [Paraglaciecola aquimarina]|uniref:C-type cytochrome domain-containing protein n=1 Tax=Paraglaciecola aquimarina TaxID=1235557 RepID=A0ABU3SRG5_9ALTE|nr:c-type cytochrome domain-containing protein [Paraglaciecola aquimarina]MDU0352575.1 c-type cytochrome domain-containing protein [Paraglaciecola aquimarina]
MTKMITPKYYFIVVGILSLLWVLLYIHAHPSWTQSIREALGLHPHLQASDNSFYNSRIDPIFEKYCTACHDDSKDKGQLRLDSYRHLTFSGKSQSDLRAADNNLLVHRMSLPRTDRMAMPPFGRERHTEEELALIELWLSKGGRGDLTEDDFPEAPAKAKVIKFADINWQKIEADRAPFAPILKDLQKRYPNVLHYQARTSSLVVLEGLPIKQWLTDDMLSEFTPLAPILTELQIASSAITDHSIELILNMPNITVINVSNTQITSNRLIELLALENLQSVIVNQTILTEQIQAAFKQRNVKLVSVNKG